MKKIYPLLTAIAAGCLMTGMAYAADNIDVVQASAGQQVTIAITVAGAPTPLAFNPSTNVNMDGKTGATSFQINAWHQQAAGKAAGQRYGMAADANTMFFTDISTVTAPADIAGTTSAAFGAWTTM